MKEDRNVGITVEEERPANDERRRKRRRIRERRIVTVAVYKYVNLAKVKLVDD